MDTVSMVNKMSFYCQPILPLVYDESMSYYETLCKVVGQLNTTGDAVNKLNEGLTGEIADRQAADALLDARIKQIEETSRKIHFLKLDTIGNLLTPGVTRENLSQWIQDGDLITMLYAPDELENSWAVATNYRCLGATGADSMQLSFYVPISVTNNAGKSGMDVAQEVVVISLPVGALTNQWTVRSITSTIPNTNADGFVNLTATVGNAGAVTCDVEPGAIVEALRNYFSGTNQYAIAVNARLTYDGKQYHSASAIVKADASGSGNIRIEFENYYNGVRAENGVSQMNTETIFLVGDVSTNAWTVETIDHKAFDFSRYEGFQFTRGENNVITANDESTPNAVYAQYHSDTSGKLYQNLPVRLIDTVDNAEYWNGVFDIKDNKHMTFTFVTSNYVTASGKMLVRVIELSADVNTTTWKYAEKEFTLPLTGGGSDTVYVDFWPTGTAEEYDKDIKGYVVELSTDQTFDAIFDSIKAGNKIVARLYEDAAKSNSPLSSVDATVSGDKTLGTINFQFVTAGTGAVAGFAFIGETITLTKTSSGTSIFLAANKNVLPTPNADGTDNGKVPTINGTSWELKTPDAGGSPDAVLYTTQTLTDAQKKQARQNVDAAIADFVVNANALNGSEVTVDKTYAQISEAIKAGKTPSVYLLHRAVGPIYLRLFSYYENQPITFSGTGEGEKYPYMVSLVMGDNGSTDIVVDRLVEIAEDGTMRQVRMDGAPYSDMEIATKKYVDDHAGGTATRVALSGTIEGEVTGYTSDTYQQIVDEIAKNCNVWLTIGGETIRLSSYKQSGASDYKLVFFGAGNGALTVKYEVTASASSASLTVTGS